MSKKLLAIVAVLMVAAFVLSACAKPTPAPTAAPTEAPVVTEAPTEAPTVAPKKLICQVTDTGGIDDKTFNSTAWKGVTDAMATLGVDGKYLESKETADYEVNLNAFIAEKCDLIIGVGYLLTDATKAAATANPGVNFTGIDFSFDPIMANFVGQEFQTDEAAYLAGYLAAGMSKTKIVGTFGGLPIPPVTIFMDGFYRGVMQWNKVHSDTVKVLGWDPANQAAALMAMSFDDQAKGKELGISLMDEGADVLFPVAGPVGLGTAAAIKERGNVWWVGVDAEMTVTQPEYADIVLTSVLKLMDVSTVAVIKSVVDGTFTGGTYVANLTNGGVGLGVINAAVPAELLTELETAKAAVLAGQVEFDPAFAKTK
jgi:basic membrane protein A